MDKCSTCLLRYNCDSDNEYYCTRNNYRLYVEEENKETREKIIMTVLSYIGVNL